MPAAIEQDFVMAWTNNDNDDIEIANIDKDQYLKKSYPLIFPKIQGESLMD